MHILILTPEYNGAGGGIITFYREMVRALSAAGVSVHVIEGSAFVSSRERIIQEFDGVTIETLERQRIERWYEHFSAFAATPGLRRHLSAAWAMWEQSGFGAAADVVEASDWGLLFIPPAVEATRPLIVQCHGSIGQISAHDPVVGEETESILTGFLERAVMSRVATLQTNSNANAAFWHKETNRETVMIRPIWQGTDVPMSPSLSNRGLVVGRVQRWKGPQIVCAALERMGGSAPFLEWIGRDTTWETRGRSAAAHLACTYPDIWGKRILHHPPLPPSEIAQRQRSALFNLVPSAWDVFNFTVVEAMASGRPTIVSSGAGASELIEDGVNGFTFPAGDPGALAVAIDRVLNESPVKLGELARAAQATVRRELDPQTIAAKRLAAYRAAIDAFHAYPPSTTSGWLAEICRSTPASRKSPTAFLHNLPLRELVAHIVTRVGQQAARYARGANR